MSTLPTAAEETRFWAVLETAWESLGPEPARLRKALLDGDSAAADALDPYLDPFVAALRTAAADLTGAELTALDRVAERTLHQLDREDIHEVTDGSDDGFLYCRGFILAVGRDYVSAVLADPSLAVVDAECESVCYLFAHQHADRFGDFPETGSGISRESFANPAGWS